MSAEALGCLRAVLLEAATDHAFPTPDALTLAWGAFGAIDVVRYGGSQTPRRPLASASDFEVREVDDGYSVYMSARLVAVVRCALMHVRQELLEFEIPIRLGASKAVFDALTDTFE